MDFELTEKLIQEVRNRPQLYLIQHPDYKNNIKKMQGWQEIQRELNEEVAALKAKWKNLKDSYRKYKQTKQGNSSDAAKKLQNWVWADHMAFLDYSVTPNETEISIVESPNVDDNLTYSFKKEETTQDIESTQETQNVQPIFRRRRRNNAKRTDRMILQYKYLQKRRRDRKLDDGKVDVKCDGVDLLFLGYADTCKTLSKRTQVKVKFDIAKVLMEAELSDLESDATPGTSSNASGSN